jgi:hypothetical protein
MARERGARKVTGWPLFSCLSRVAEPGRGSVSECGTVGWRWRWDWHCRDASSRAGAGGRIASPYADGGEHVEPIVYNGKRYDVSLRFQPAGNVYDVTVAGNGRKLGGTPGDQQIVEQVAISAVRHFGCPTGQRGHVVSGSARHGGSAWGMQVRCA